jgi:hypothetical protein
MVLLVRAAFERDSSVHQPFNDNALACLDSEWALSLAQTEDGRTRPMTVERARELLLNAIPETLLKDSKGLLLCDMRF